MKGTPFKRFVTTLILSSMITLPCFADDATNEAAKEAEQLKKMSRTFGFYMGQSMKEMKKKIAFDVDQVIDGIKVGYAGGEAPMSQQEYETEFMKLRLSLHSKESAENLKEAEAFLAEKKLASGVLELVPGKLYYEIVTAGKGDAVTEHTQPVVHYEGKFINGTVFSSSIDKEPFPVDLNHVIAGFKQGLMGAKIGEKRRLYIHPELAYGDQGNLPPNSLLIFEIEVIKLEEAPKVEETPKIEEHKTEVKEEHKKEEHTTEQPKIESQKTETK